MGRYFPYRIHPLSVGEATLPTANIHTETLIQDPVKPPKDTYESLWQFGGFPEPFLRQNKRFHTRWMKLRAQQLFQEDIRDTSSVEELDQMEVLAHTLLQQTGQLLNYTSLAKKMRASDKTIRRWITILDSFFFCTSQPTPGRFPRHDHNPIRCRRNRNSGSEYRRGRG